MEQLLKKVSQIIRNNKKQKWIRGGIMSAACLVVFMTTYLLILPAITISLDQADEEPGFDVEAQGELLLSDGEQGGNDEPEASGSMNVFAVPDDANDMDHANYADLNDNGDTAALFGEEGGDSDEVFFSGSDGSGYDNDTPTASGETAGPFEYTYSDEETGWKVTVSAELLGGAVLPSDARMSAKLIRVGTETEQDTYKEIETKYSEALKASEYENTEDPIFYQLLFEKDGETLITEETYAPARITFRFYEPAPQGDISIVTGEYSSLTEQAEMRQTLLIQENNSYTIIADVENAASFIGVSKAAHEGAAALPETEEVQFETEIQTNREEQSEIEIKPETEAEPGTEIQFETAAETETEAVAETEAESETALETEEAETEEEAETGNVTEAAEEETESVTKTADEEETESATETADEEETECVTEATEEETEGVTEAATEEETEGITEAAIAEEKESETEAITEESTESITEAETEEETGEETEEETEALESVYEDELEEETESIIEEETEEETESISEAETEGLLSALTYEGADYTITLSYGADAEIPEDAFLEVREIEKGSEEYNMYLAASGIALENEGKQNGTAENVEARFFDITIMHEDGKIEPKGAVSVDIAYHEAIKVAENGEVNAVHFDDKGETSVLEAYPQGDGGEISSVSFDTDSFSVFGIVYTVDFHYEVNGKMYEFSIPGGGFVTLQQLVEVLGISNTDTTSENASDDAGNSGDFSAADDEYSVGEVPGVDTDTYEENFAEVGEEQGVSDSGTYEQAITLNNVVVSDKTREFVADIESVEFSNPSLVWVGKVEAESTVAGLKDTYGLDYQYSVELTEAQIAEINAHKVQAGDWALISVKPFDTVETLTVTMKNGDRFQITVTDAQLSADVLTAAGETYRITITYDDDAQIPNGTKLVASEIEPGTDEYIQHLGQAWSEVNKEYFEVEEKRENYDESMGELPDVPYTNINTARFFDISLIYNDEEIEPKVPVQVEISYVQGLEAWEETTPGVAHYVSENQVEILEDIETTILENEVTSFRYEQESFSVVGTYVGQEIKDNYAEPKLAAAPDPYGSAVMRSANLTDEVLDEVVRSSLNSSDLLRAGETEQPDSNDNTELKKPEAHKSLTPNKDVAGAEDGTYTLTLSVKGHSSITTETQQKKANVLVVMDRSSSMITGRVSDEETFWYYGTANTSVFRQDIGDPNDSKGKNYHFYGVVNDEYVELNTNFTNWDAVTFTYWDGTYDYPYGPYGPSSKHYVSYPKDDPLYVKSPKTRMTAEQEALSTLFGELMEMNDAAGANKDMVEISVISFADKRYDNKDWAGETEVGWQSGRNTATLMNAVLSNRFTSGTNWEEALQYAYDVISAKKTAEENAGKTNEDYYVVFLTDGEPTNSVDHSLVNKAWAGNDTQRAACYDAAKDDAKKLVDDGYNFYNIFTFRTTEDEKYSIYLSNYAYGEEDYKNDKDLAISHNYSDAKTIDALRNAFNNIFFTIEDSIGHGNVSITDTLTTDAMTTTVVQGKANGYVYEVRDGSGTLLYTVTATGDLSDPTVVFNVPASSIKDYTATASAVGGKTVYSVTTAEGNVYKMALADVNDETGELAWDLSPVGLLMNDCTYSVSFVVWPDQDAYDYVAALNNGLTSVVNSKGETIEVKWDEEAATDSGKGYCTGGVAQYPSIVKYPDGTFAVLTNTDQKLHYSVVETNNGETTITGPFYKELETPDPMPLTATSSQIEKQWNVERDPGILAQLLYDHEGDPTKYKIEFAILKDDDGTTSEDDEVNTYTTVKLGWSDEENKYLWEADSVRNVTYSGHSCQVGTRWATDFSIATGLMLSEERMDAIGLDKTAYPYGEYNGVTYYVLETGHDYTIKEPGLTYEFDFDGPTYHPMLVDGVLRSVNLTADEDAKTVAISNMTSAEVRLSSLKIENTLRGYINLDKVVVGMDGTTQEAEDDTKFEYTVILQNDTEPGPFTVEGSHVPWYGISGLYYHTIDDDGETFHYYQAVPQGVGKVKLTDEDGNEYMASCEGTFAEDVGPEAITYTDGSGNEKTIQLYGNRMDHTSDNYVSATIQIEQGQTLNIANVPVGTQYTITETDKSGYELVKIEREIKVSPEAEAESGDTVTGTSTITGTIVGNRDNHIIYTNKTTTTSVGVEKVWDTPAGLSAGTADVVLYKVVGKKADELGEGEIDPAKPSQKIRITVDATLISESTGEPSGVSKLAYIDIAYTGTGTGSYRLSNENGWKHTFEFERGGTYNFTCTPDGTRVKSVSPVESTGIDTTTTIPLTAVVEDIPQHTYTFTVPAAERQSRGGIIVTCNGGEKTANTDNDWTVTFTVANEAFVTYNAAPTNGFITTVTLDPAATVGEEATANKTVQMHPVYAATTLTIPVTVNWTGTAPAGTSVTIHFSPDKEGVSEQSLTLDGSESWTSSKTLDRLDGNGDLITWTVTTGAEAPSSHQVSVSLQSPAGAEISDTAENVVVNGTSTVATMTVPVSVNWGTSTPDAGTTVTVTFTNGTTTETVTLNGSESTAWTTSKELPRLDASGKPLTWTVSTQVTSPDDNASVSGAPATVSDSDGDGTADAVAMTGTVDRKMNLTVKTSGSVNIGGFYKATMVNGTVYFKTADSAGALSGYGTQNKMFTGLDIKDDSDGDQYYAIVLWDESPYSRTNAKTDLTTADYTINAREDNFTLRTVIYFKAEAGNKTLELTKGNGTNGQILTGQTMNSVNPTASVYSASGRSLLKAGGGNRLIGAANTGSPVQTFHDTAIEAGSPAFTAVQFKDLPEGAVFVEFDGSHKSGTQTLTGNAGCTWSGLPTEDEEGRPIYYYVVEKSATAQADSMSVKYAYEYNADGTIKKVIITNTTEGTPTPTTGDITVTKSFSGVDALPEGFKITNNYDDQEFTIANATGTNPYTWKLTGIPDETTVTFTESGTTVNGYNLEVKANGTVVANSSVSASVVAGETVTASLVNTYTPKTVTVTLKKVDKSKLSTVTDLSALEASDLLDGAKFILEKYNKLSPQEEKDSEWCDEHNAINSGEGGVFIFSNLPVGIYKIIERERPAGYVTTTSVPAFEVVVDDATGDLKINLLNNAGDLVRLVDGELTIVVGNEPGAALPNTGGPGTTLFYMIGLMLTALAGAGLVMKKRRRNAA